MTRFWDGRMDRRTDGQTDGVTWLLDLLSPLATQVKTLTQQNYFSLIYTWVVHGFRDKTLHFPLSKNSPFTVRCIVSGDGIFLPGGSRRSGPWWLLIIWCLCTGWSVWSGNCLRDVLTKRNKRPMSHSAHLRSRVLLAINKFVQIYHKISTIILIFFQKVNPKNP